MGAGAARRRRPSAAGCRRHLRRHDPGPRARGRRRPRVLHVGVRDRARRGTARQSRPPRPLRLDLAVRSEPQAADRRGQRLRRSAVRRVRHPEGGHRSHAEGGDGIRRSGHDLDPSGSHRRAWLAPDRSAGEHRSGGVAAAVVRGRDHAARQRRRDAAPRARRRRRPGVRARRRASGCRGGRGLQHRRAHGAERAGVRRDRLRLVRAGGDAAEHHLGRLPGVGDRGVRAGELGTPAPQPRLHDREGSGTARLRPRV